MSYLYVTRGLNTLSVLKTPWSKYKLNTLNIANQAFLSQFKSVVVVLFVLRVFIIQGHFLADKQSEPVECIFLARLTEGYGINGSNVQYKDIRNNISDVFSAYWEIPQVIFLY